jgi:hypothetical protein
LKACDELGRTFIFLMPISLFPAFYPTICQRRQQMKYGKKIHLLKVLISPVSSFLPSSLNRSACDNFLKPPALICLMILAIFSYSPASSAGDCSIGPTIPAELNRACMEAEELSWDQALEPPSDEDGVQLAAPGAWVIHVKGGVGPYTWTVSGNGYHFAEGDKEAVSDKSHITLFADFKACGVASISVKDSCSKKTITSAYRGPGHWARKSTTCQLKGKPTEILHKGTVGLRVSGSQRQVEQLGQHSYGLQYGLCRPDSCDGFGEYYAYSIFYYEGMDRCLEFDLTGYENDNCYSPGRSDQYIHCQFIAYQAYFEWECR